MLQFTKEEWDSRKITPLGVLEFFADSVTMLIFFAASCAAVLIALPIIGGKMSLVLLALIVIFMARVLRLVRKVMNPRRFYQVVIERTDRNGNRETHYISRRT